MVCCVEAYGIYKINSQKIKRINKTEASVREPPAQVFSKRNLLQKTGQPTNGRLSLIYSFNLLTVDFVDAVSLHTANHSEKVKS